MILRNAIQTPDGTILESHSNHDYKEYHDKVVNDTYMVDGGLCYSHRSLNKIPAKSLLITTEDVHDVIREGFSWGTYGKHGDQPFKYKLLRDLSDEHIDAILRTQKQLPEDLRDVFFNEQEYRTNASID